MSVCAKITRRGASFGAREKTARAYGENGAMEHSGHPADGLKWKHLYRKAEVIFFSEWRTLVTSVVAIIIYSVGVAAFTLPYRFADQGVTGVSVLVKYAFGINPAYTLLALNVVMLAWGARTLNRRFLIWTVFNAFFLSFALDLMQTIQFPVIEDRFLVAVVGSAIKGFGAGLLYRQGVCIGGLDIAISVLRKKYGLEIGKISIYFNMTLLLISIGIIGLTNAMYGFVSCYVNGMAMDRVLSSFEKRKLVFVVTSHTEAVAEFISQHLDRSCTLLKSEGGYKHHAGFTIMTLLRTREAVELKAFLAQNYPGAFMVLAEADEVVGRGFKRWRNV